MDKFIRTYASNSPKIEKENYVRRVCEDLNIPKTTIIKQALKRYQPKIKSDG